MHKLAQAEYFSLISSYASNVILLFHLQDTIRCSNIEEQIVPLIHWFLRASPWPLLVLGTTTLSYLTDPVITIVAANWPLPFCNHCKHVGFFSTKTHCIVSLFDGSFLCKQFVSSQCPTIYKAEFEMQTVYNNQNLYAQSMQLFKAFNEGIHFAASDWV